ncbi:PAS domain-containing protein [Tautonia marina]|uniref:PAS domain-containing protein n=1 Tax=Tautonia marina TaxID=2653855 RepID=UPI0012606DC5|nr:PAS domain-containing protein [Tautonia marina]
MIAGELRTVLNVHGDGETREAVSRLLVGEGLRSRDVPSTAEARAALAGPEARDAGLILLDASLDEAESFCREVLRSTPSVPLVLTRAQDTPLSEGLSSLAVEVLDRPPDESRWLAAIRAWTRVGGRVQELGAEAERWRSIFEAIDEGMALLDPDGRIRWCNIALAGLLRDKPTALLGQRLSDRAAHLIPPGRQWPHDRTLRSGSRSRDEWELEHHWFRSAAAPVRNAIGSLSGVVTTIEDVSHEVRLRQRIAQVEAEAEARSERIDRLERDARLYQALAGIPVRPEDLGAPRHLPLSREMPEVFCDALEDFGRVLDLRLLRRSYQTQHQPDGSAILSALAERLATAGAGPRDVIELHAMALRQRSSGTKAAKVNVYAEEAQLAVLELMGRLAEHYRAGLAAATRNEAVASDRSPDFSE